MLKKSKCFSFLQSLHFALVSSVYWNVILRPKQVVCLEKVFLGKDVLGVLPTGYGKSLIFHVLPLIFFAKERLEKGIEFETLTPAFNDSFSPVIIVISPLNSLINDQISRLASTGIRASVLKVKHDSRDGRDEELFCDVQLSEKDRLQKAYYNIVFAHPESLLSCKFGRELLNSKAYQENVRVIDEAHCILEW